MDNASKGWPYSVLLIFSLTLGSYLFFLNPSLTRAFDFSPDNIEWYAIFSQNITHPNTSYIAESVLLPLFAKLLGASTSTQTYRLLCALLTISLLPIIATVAWRFFNDIVKAFLFVLVFGTTFAYLSSYRLGFPDPLTIALLAFTALQRKPISLYLGSLLAALSHFSMSVFALSALILLLTYSPMTNRTQRVQSLKFIVLGLISGRLLLALWFYVFEYKLTSRVDFVLENGLEFFINHHKQSYKDFWLAPGLFFLTSYFIIIGYFFVQRKGLFATALFAALFLAYTAHFFAVDGLRVFAVVIASAYTFMLAVCIDSLSNKIEIWSKQCRIYISRASQFVKLRELRIGLGFPAIAAWLFFIGLASKKGLFINELPFLHIQLFGIRFLDYALVSCSVMIFLTFITPKLRATPYLIALTKIMFIFPLLIIGIQYLRQSLGDGSYFSPGLKALSLCLALCLAVLSTKIELSNIGKRIFARISLFNKKSH